MINIFLEIKQYYFTSFYRCIIPDWKLNFHKIQSTQLGILKTNMKHNRGSTEFSN